MPVPRVTARCAWHPLSIGFLDTGHFCEPEGRQIVAHGVSRVESRRGNTPPRQRRTAPTARTPVPRVTARCAWHPLSIGFLDTGHFCEPEGRQIVAHGVSRVESRRGN